MGFVQKSFLILAILMLVVLFFIGIFGDNGLAELNRMKKNKAFLAEQNKVLTRENLVLYRTIERLKEDTTYIEEVARQELGMVGENEVIFKFNRNQEIK